MSPVAATLEDIALSWLLELLGPAGGGGARAFVDRRDDGQLLLPRGGAAPAACARGLGRRGPRPLSAHRRCASSSRRRPTRPVLKALALLGLGRERVTRVPSDEQGRLRADHLPELDATTIVCAQAGNVNTGSCDPFAALCSGREARRRVGPRRRRVRAVARPRPPGHAGLVAGLAEADSWAADAHKWL
jgi:hypothetical protein